MAEEAAAATALGMEEEAWSMAAVAKKGEGPTPCTTKVPDTWEAVARQWEVRIEQRAPSAPAHEKTAGNCNNPSPNERVKTAAPLVATRLFEWLSESKTHLR